MKLSPGLAFHLLDDGSWKIEKIPSSVLSSAKESGTLKIEGFPTRVFETPDGEMWAQKEVLTASTTAWQRPSLDSARAEIERFCGEHHIDVAKAEEIFNHTALRTLAESLWFELMGESYYEVDGLDECREVAEEDSRDVESFLDKIGQGQKIDAPILMRIDDGSTWVVDGSTRLLAARGLGLLPQALLIDMTSKDFAL